MTQTPQSYFDLHISGIGYLRRFREITPRQGGRRHTRYFAVSISALEGPTDNPSYAWFDASVVGSKALEALQQVRDHVNGDGSKVLASFKLGGINPDIYQVRTGAHAGEPRVALKTRLLRIRWIKLKAKGGSRYDTIYTEPAEAGTDAEAGVHANGTADAPERPVRAA